MGLGERTGAGGELGIGVYGKKANGAEPMGRRAERRAEARSGKTLQGVSGLRLALSTRGGVPRGTSISKGFDLA